MTAITEKEKKIVLRMFNTIVRVAYKQDILRCAALGEQINCIALSCHCFITSI